MAKKKIKKSDKKRFVSEVKDFKVLYMPKVKPKSKKKQKRNVKT